MAIAYIAVPSSGFFDTATQYLEMGYTCVGFPVAEVRQGISVKVDDREAEPAS